jgi:SH3 domain protein
LTRNLDFAARIWKNPFSCTKNSTNIVNAKILIGLAALAGTMTCQAETRYVTDEVTINLRSGESTSHRILKTLKSGAPVEVLSSNADNGYTKVRIDGVEGYVLTYQLMSAPSARDRLAAAEARLQTLQQEPSRLAQQLGDLRDNNQKLQKDNAELQSAKMQLEQDLEGIKRTSTNAVQIANERNDLRSRVIALTRQVEDLKQENRDLSQQSAQRWFLIGGGIVTLGIILGLILPHLRFQRRRNSWGSL